jgi:hypothetical protein
VGIIQPNLAGQEDDWADYDYRTMRALGSVWGAFAGWDRCNLDPRFLINGNKVFRNNEIVPGYVERDQLAPGFIAKKGYSAAMKTCLAGLVLVCDMVVSAFLAGGEMIELMRVTGEFRNVDEMMQACNREGGMDIEFYTFASLAGSIIYVGYIDLPCCDSIKHHHYDY